MFLILIIFIFCLFYTFFSISRGWSSLTEIIFTVICAIWLSFYCFNTLRIPIQKHVRIILEMNYELDFDDQDEHKLSIINRIPIVFLFWIIFFWLQNLHSPYSVRCLLNEAYESISSHPRCLRGQNSFTFIIWTN